MKKEDLRIVFMGTPEFAAETLKRLLENGYHVVGVVTVQDKPAGRGRKLMESDVKKLAMQHKLPVLQPEKLKSQPFNEALQALKPDVQVVVAFRMLPEMVWRLPKHGTFNLHASLLPDYRGAAPINWAIINGESTSGVTTFFIDDKIDTGEIIDQQKVEITEHMNAGELHDALMLKGAELVQKTIDRIIKGSIRTIPQSELVNGNKPLNPAPKLFKDDCLINWNDNGKAIYNKIRGLSPYPAAWSPLKFVDDSKNTTFKIFKASFEPGEVSNPGSISTDDKTYLKIACADGWINAEHLQIAGKKRMPLEDLLRGFSLKGSSAI